VKVPRARPQGKSPGRTTEMYLRGQKAWIMAVSSPRRSTIDAVGPPNVPTKKGEVDHAPVPNACLVPRSRARRHCTTHPARRRGAMSQTVGRDVPGGGTVSRLSTTARRKGRGLGHSSRSVRDSGPCQRDATGPTVRTGQTRPQRRAEKGRVVSDSMRSHRRLRPSRSGLRLATVSCSTTLRSRGSRTSQGRSD
jgi:hypothetical protein